MFKPHHAMTWLPHVLCTPTEQTFKSERGKKTPPMCRLVSELGVERNAASIYQTLFVAPQSKMVEHGGVD